MIEFYDGQLTDLLPHNLTNDPGAQAYSYALREGTRLLYRYAQLCYVYCSIDTMPDKILDLLAVELRTQYYTDSLDLETKRNLVRNTLIWYMTAGTPAAVEELTTVVFGEGTVKEWFEYGDAPYYFKVETTAILVPELLEFFLRMIQQVKNTRSHLRSIDIRRSINHIVFSGVGQISYYRPAAIMEGYSVTRETGQRTRLGTAIFQETHPEAILSKGR